MTQTDGTKTQTDSVYDSSMLVEEIVQHFDSTGAQIGATDTVTYLQGPSGPLYRKSSLVTDPVWYVYDGLGSVVGELDVNGNLTGSKLYDVYGATRSLSGSPTSRQGFVGALGHETDDETGLVYMRARYYDPLIGRFASEDPGYHGVNWFTYCHNDPVNFNDASGADESLVEMSVTELGEATIDGVGLDPEATEIYANMDRPGRLDIDVRYIKSLDEKLNIRAMLQAIETYARTGNARLITITAGGLTYQGERLMNAMNYLINRMGDTGVLQAKDNGITQLYWLLQDD